MKIANWIVLSGSLCAAFTVTPAALADPKTHDGFYLQAAGGLGYLSSSAEVAGTTVSYHGLSFPSHLLLGGTPGGGFVIGGGFLGDWVPAPSATIEGGGVSGTVELTDVTLTLIGLGPFIDFYPDPAKGLHFQALVGWGGLEASYQGNAGGSDPTGLVLSIGGGHEWWVSTQWSIGVMGRLVYAPLSLNDISYTTIAPALMATFTYH